MAASTQALPLAGKVAIVTGASRGIGASIALELANRGAKVAITYVSPSSAKLADELVSTINSLGNGASAIKIQADMADTESPKKIVTETVTAFGESIDILVNNAGVGYQDLLPDLTMDGYNNVMNVNVRSVIFMTQAVLPHLRSPGRIINIGSAMGRLGFPKSSVYSATKAALEALSRGWASELGVSGHTVNVVAPALTETDMIQNIVSDPESAQLIQMQKMMTPLENRLGKPEDIALVVALIADPASRWITGQTIQSGGGILMT
ncbi:short-chain dehydrogenase/reductase-like protein SDR [Corynespora cassiicola Philippines]|uniref:Short-chain dehydrogenase/reductase-like protein SDR n=1 Tax=Corynespora cassiicola Philippines TaxID=1448308 RepID=A0A2T2NH74_CORCC|nr:short-chain dehydrogenase/reductase-like protein SDR [Corynespora cassiicola Philippines]